MRSETSATAPRQSSFSPLLILVGGAPAAGKSELSRILAAELELPVIGKDLIKDELLAKAGTVDLATSQALGHASMGLLFRLLEVFLGRGVSLIAEAPFAAKLHGDRMRTLVAGVAPQAVQVHCRASPARIRERLLARSSSAHRHRGHLDVSRIEQTMQDIVSGFWSPVPLPGVPVFDYWTGPSAADGLSVLLGKVRAVVNGSAGRIR